MIVIAILSVIAMAQGREDIEGYGKAKKAWLSQFLKQKHGIPHHNVYQWVIIRIQDKRIESG
ncbi:MAG: transposase family protein [Treponema sp.]|nr:transposase family protein [Treponema sp.]